MIDYKKYFRLNFECDNFVYGKKCEHYEFGYGRVVYVDDKEVMCIFDELPFHNQCKTFNKKGIFKGDNFPTLLTNHFDCRNIKVGNIVIHRDRVNFYDKSEWGIVLDICDEYIVLLTSNMNLEYVYSTRWTTSKYNVTKLVRVGYCETWKLEKLIKEYYRRYDPLYFKLKRLELSDVTIGHILNTNDFINLPISDTKRYQLNCFIDKLLSYTSDIKTISQLLYNSLVYRTTIIWLLSQDEIDHIELEHRFNYLCKVADVTFNIKNEFIKDEVVKVTGVASQSIYDNGYKIEIPIEINEDGLISNVVSSTGTRIGLGKYKSAKIMILLNEEDSK